MNPSFQRKKHKIGIIKHEKQIKFQMKNMMKKEKKNVHKEEEQLEHEEERERVKDILAIHEVNLTAS